jgi:hypothetical protein
MQSGVNRCSERENAEKSKQRQYQEEEQIGATESTQGKKKRKSGVFNGTNAA